MRVPHVGCFAPPGPVANPYTPAAISWERHEFRVRRAGQGRWIVLHAIFPAGGGSPRVLGPGGMHTAHYAAIRSASSIAAVESYRDPRNPHPYVVLDDSGDCHIAYVAGAMGDCPNIEALHPGLFAQR